MSSTFHSKEEIIQSNSRRDDNGNDIEIEREESSSSSSNVLEGIQGNTVGGVHSLIYQLEPYGSVPPHDSRLFKVLQDGFPLFEPTIVHVEEDEAEEEDESHSNVGKIQTADQELEATNHFLLRAERRVKRITGELDQLRHNVEKFFVVMDREIRAQQMLQDPVCRNQPTWQSAEINKAEALRKIADLREVFQLTNPSFSGSGTETKQLCFVPSVKMPTTDHEWLTLVMAMTRRQALYRPCLEMTENIVREVRLSTNHQRRFLQLLRNIRCHWKVQRIPYASHVYEKGDDYPYRAEIRIELLSIPSSCWGYDRKRKWSLPQHAGVAHVPIGGITAPPFTLWPPLPAVPPTASAIADVYCTATTKKKNIIDSVEGGKKFINKQTESQDDGDDDSSLRVQIRWIGDASHCIEAGRELQVRIIPISIMPCFEETSIKPHGQRATSNQEGGLFMSSIHSVSKMNRTSEMPNDKKFPRKPHLLPSPLGGDATWVAEASKLHSRLQTAQWRLVDRAIHLIWQAQASRLKDVLDVASFGNREGSFYAKSILQEFESLRRHLAVELLKTQGTRKDTSQKLPNLLVQINREITVERWETYMTSLAIRNIPIYGPIDPNEAVSLERPPKPLFRADVEVWINYLPSKSSVATLDHNTSFKDFSSLNKETDFNSVYINEFLRRLPIVESLGVCYLRHQFLVAWKSTIHDLPRACFDLYPLSVASARVGAGAFLFVDFLDWIQTFLVARMLTKLPASVLRLNLPIHVQQKQNTMDMSAQD